MLNVLVPLLRIMKNVDKLLQITQLDGQKKSKLKWQKIYKK